MARVKNGAVTKARHKKVLKAASGYFGSKHRLYKTAKEQLMHSGQYAYRDRKQTKRNFRKLWIIRINAECRENEISYSRFIDGLTKAGVEVNRKMLSEIAINDKVAFKELVMVAKNGKVNETKVVVKKEVKAEQAAKEETIEIKKEVVDVKEETTDLTKMTVAELKEMAEAKNIANAKTMKKAELIEALK